MASGEPIESCVNARELRQLLDEASAFIRRFLVLRTAQADVCALWCMHTHALGAAEFTPYLHIFAASLRAGKTLLLKLLALLVAKPWYTGRVTGAVLVRKTDKEHPTLLLDESDTAFHMGGEYSERLRGILNTGFERDGTISLCVGKDWDPKDFSSFSPKAIAGIGRLPETVEDRAIPIELKRKLRSEKCESFRKRRAQTHAAQLRERLEQCAKEYVEVLRGAEPAMPEELNDRQCDVCEPLLAISDLAGGDWPQRARAALLELYDRQAKHDESAATLLLGDIRMCFDKRGDERLPTTNLLNELRAIEDSPWDEYQRGWPLTASGLARLLKPFGVRPRDLRFDRAILKGYLRDDFTDPWERYLLPCLPLSDAEGQQGQQASIHASPSTFCEGQQQSHVAARENAKTSVNMRVVADVAAAKPEAGGDGSAHCGVHPSNLADWWLRGDDLVCGRCHPNPN